jgi:ER-bound oxygenase mpaB/B'/Rubber oxygenase, catalytic domain
LALNTNGPISADQVEEICKLRDDVYRNRWITFAYWSISQRLRSLIGQENASWYTFATWSSRTVGENLRFDKATRRIEELIYDEQTSISPRDHPWLLRLQYRVTTRDDGAAQLALAIGNHHVFHEIGYSVVQFLDWVDKNRDFDQGRWKAYRETIEPYEASDLFPAGNVEQLRSGLESYYRARYAADRKEKAELVLRGNVLLGAYEQWRLEPLLKVALEPFRGRFVRVIQADPHAPDTLSFPDAGTPWALRHRASALRIISALFGGFVTRWVMALDAPLFAWVIRPIRPGHGIPRPAGVSLHPPALQTLGADMSTLFGEYDRSGGSPEGCAARNWTRFSDRMNFITNLFRTGQQDENLYRRLPDADLRTLELDLSDAKLDRLRTVGDNEIDPWIEEHVAAKRVDPRHYVEDLIADGFADLLAADPSTPELPDWADAAKLWAGQEFFRRFGLEIGSTLFAASLPISYTAARGARVLTTTSALVSDTRRRLAETGQMLLDAMAFDDSWKPPLDRDTRAYQAARGVRLFHGAVRHMILIDPAVNWHKQRLGVPINQEDLVGTLAVFTVAVIESLDQMGVTCTLQDRDAYFHLWLVIGHLLGIDYDGLYRRKPRSTQQPLTYADMQLIARVIFARNAQASPGGRELMAALLNVSEGSMPFLLKGLPRTVTRRMIGDKSADLLGVPPAGPMRVLTAALRPFNAIVSPYVRTNALGGLTSTLTRRLYRSWIDDGHGNRPPWRFPAQWLEPAPKRARRQASQVVNRLPVVPGPAKKVISGIVSPD